MVNSCSHVMMVSVSPMASYHQRIVICLKGPAVGLRSEYVDLRSAFVQRVDTQLHCVPASSGLVVSWNVTLFSVSSSTSLLAYSVNKSGHVRTLLVTLKTSSTGAWISTALRI